LQLLYGQGLELLRQRQSLPIIPQERHGEGISYYGMSTTVASAIVPFLGMYLYQHASFYTILILCVILLGVSYIAAFFLKLFLWNHLINRWFLLIF
jgi:hypothetical protein